MAKGVCGTRKHLCSCIWVKMKTVAWYSLTKANLHWLTKYPVMVFPQDTFWQFILLREHSSLQLTIKARFFIYELYLGEQSLDLPNLKHLLCIEIRSVPIIEA